MQSYWNDDDGHPLFDDADDWENYNRAMAAAGVRQALAQQKRDRDACTICRGDMVCASHR